MMDADCWVDAVSRSHTDLFVMSVSVREGFLDKFVLSTAITKAAVSFPL